MPVATLTLLFLGVMLVLSILLCFWGLRGRRVGDEPHCRACGYNLTGSPGEKCSECGREITGRNVVQGTRRRHRRTIAVGAAMLVVSVFGLGSAGYIRAKSVNWYPHLPVFMLLSQARSDDQLALAELMQRYAAGSVSSRRLAELAPVALARQGVMTIPRPTSVMVWTDLLAALDGDGQLTKEQREQFYDQILAVHAVSQRIVRQGESCSAALFWQSSVSSRLRGTVAIKDIELRLGGELQYRDDGRVVGWLSSGLNGGRSGGAIVTDDLVPGRYTGEFRTTITFSDCDIRQRITRTFEFEVGPADVPDPVRLVDDPELAEAFRKSITIETKADPFGTSADSVGTWIWISVDKNVPMNGAFDVFARIGNHEIRLGTCTARPAQDEAVTWRISEMVGDAEYFVPILRASTDEARRPTIDIPEIWDGELVFDPVKINRAPHQSAESQAAP